MFKNVSRATAGGSFAFFTYSDDEHLFFAGIIPYFAAEKGFNVQVVYFTNPWLTHGRAHEMLNGLWTAGLRNYPAIGSLPDLYSESLDGARRVFEGQGFTEEDVIGIQTEQIRRFRPLVAVSHDVNGEYGHGRERLQTRDDRNCGGCVGFCCGGDCGFRVETPVTIIYYGGQKWEITTALR